MHKDFIKNYLAEVSEIASKLEVEVIQELADLIFVTRQKKGRLFILGVGGSAANASHAVNDFRKIVQIDAVTPVDNVSELTARTNDEGWKTVFESWLKISRLDSKDMVLIFSVGGGNEEKNISSNLVKAIDYAKEKGVKVAGIVGPVGGYTALKADVCIKIPEVNKSHITPHSEAFQAVIWHLLVSHPLLKVQETKWEFLK